MKRAALCCPPDTAAFVFAKGRLERLAGLVSLAPGGVDESAIDARLPELGDVEVIFASWGMPHLTPARLDALPALRAIFYAAGTVRPFGTTVLERGITLVSAWRANALPVAEFTLAQILLSMKAYFADGATYHDARRRPERTRGLGNFQQTVALLGAGAIGTRLTELLGPFDIDVVVFDPYLGGAAAAGLGVRKVTLDEAFARATVVSNHLANVPATVGLLRGDHFRAMGRDATFLNTGRGAQVREAELIEVLRERPDLTALLDVTDPEPPLPDSPLWTLPNVRLSPHIAGSIGNEVVRMADLVIDEFLRWQAGEPLRHQVTPEMLKRMA